ncbi:hypothetical protein SSX86_017336 [Deinandra increscens subsp. villosa]|uniref:Uncharacterized protein n=1 Tax=Deinandra increscens subsp. villosa TaxID=3103831 RepID=A0AAP0GVK4_9ASTR
MNTSSPTYHQYDCFQSTTPPYLPFLIPANCIRMSREATKILRSSTLAKVDLKEEMPNKDAMEVIEITKEFMYGKYVDEHGFVDLGQTNGTTHQKEAKRF